jgi:hypothetical protein
VVTLCIESLSLTGRTVSSRLLGKLSPAGNCVLAVDLIFTSSDEVPVKRVFRRPARKTKQLHHDIDPISHSQMALGIALHRVILGRL